MSTLIDRIVAVLDFPESFGIPFEDYPEWDQGSEPVPLEAQSAVLAIGLTDETFRAAQLEHVRHARTLLHP